MAKRNTYHVLPNPKGGWDVKKSGAERASGHYDTKKEAESAGKIISQNQNSEFIVHGRNGEIQRSDINGNDPNPPKDQDSKKEATILAFQKAYDSHQAKNH